MTSRTTRGRNCPTRTRLMYGSLGSTFDTISRSVGVSSMPSMSTTSRSGGVSRIMKCENVSGASCSSVTRV
jgi:hypothetical protein